MILIAAIYGVIFGSFFAAWYMRLFSEKAITKGRSVCDHCGHPLALKDLIPLVSWLWLRGYCRYCRKPIDGYHFMIELTMMLLAVGVYLREDPQNLLGWVGTVMIVLFFGAMLIAGLYDLKTKYIPMNPVYLAGGLAVALIFVRNGADSPTAVSLLGALAVAAAMAALFWSINVLSKGKSLGLGDAYLIVPMGLFLGPVGFFIGLFLGSTVGSVVSLAMMYTKKLKRKDTIPFGPYLVLGLILAYFIGPVISNWILIY